MSLTAFVLIALKEAEDICIGQVNVSICHPLPLPSSTQGTCTLEGEVLHLGDSQSSPSALTASKAAIIIPNIWGAIN